MLLEIGYCSRLKALRVFSEISPNKPLYLGARQSENPQFQKYNLSPADYNLLAFVDGYQILFNLVFGLRARGIKFECFQKCISSRKEL